MSQRVTGTVEWFDGSKGYGVIQREEGMEVFVHYLSIVDNGFKNLWKGDKVEFTIESTLRGPQAVDVVRV